MLKTAKRIGLIALRGAGAFSVARASSWRRRRLLILCYHGIAIDDEAVWNPWLYISLATFERRLEILRRGGYAMLPLTVALDRLRRDDLPERAVAMTFDDGMHDFATRALPVLAQANCPVTVYLATQSVEHGLPVFPLLCSYLLWKGRGRTIDLSGLGLPGPAVHLSDDNAHNHVLRQLLQTSITGNLGLPERHDLATRLAHRLDIDLEPILERRLLTVMDRAEVTAVARSGVDFQLHTHRHYSPDNEDEYRSEIRLNRTSIEALTGRRPTHFCYPSGIHDPAFTPWLEAEGVQSAVTCSSGYATPSTPLLELPRLLDHGHLSDIEFEAWTSGAGHWLPSRAPAPPIPVQLGLVNAHASRAAANRASRLPRA